VWYSIKDFLNPEINIYEINIPTPGQFIKKIGGKI
jgi:hypothetical protein